jgi:hypothetical protein
MSEEKIELESAHAEVVPNNDHRPHIPEPPPVRLIAVSDVHLPAAAGKEVELDAFYVGLLHFHRDAAEQGVLIYRADNFRLIFDILEPPITRDEIRPTGILVRSLATLQEQLIEREIEFEWHRGIAPGMQRIVLQDPARNWISVGERREVS